MVDPGTGAVEQDGGVAERVGGSRGPVAQCAIVRSLVASALDLGDGGLLDGGLLLRRIPVLGAVVKDVVRFHGEGLVPKVLQRAPVLQEVDILPGCVIEPGGGQVHPGHVGSVEALQRSRHGCVDTGQL